MDLNFSFLTKYWPMFVRGAGTTLVLSLFTVILGLILAVLCSLSMTNYASPNGGVNLPALFIGAAALAALLKFKVSIPVVIASSALLGLVLIR